METLNKFGSSSNFFTRATCFVVDGVTDFITCNAEDCFIDCVDIKPLAPAEVHEPGLEEVPG